MLKNNFNYMELDECCICFNNLKKNKLLTKLDCNHTYHTLCIYKWAKQNNNTTETNNNKIVINGLCPICNSPFIKSINKKKVKSKNKIIKLCCFIL